jgi:hypothetical protein
MKNILCIEDIVESTFITPFFNTSNINMAEFVDSHKVVWMNAFSAFTIEKNESV